MAKKKFVLDKQPLSGSTNVQPFAQSWGNDTLKDYIRSAANKFEGSNRFGFLTAIVLAAAELRYEYKPKKSGVSEDACL